MKNYILLFLVLIFTSLILYISLTGTAKAEFSDHSSPAQQYQKYCAGCHGVELEAFVDRDWKYGKSDADIFKAIKIGYPNDGMPGFAETFTDQEIQEMTDYIKEGVQNVNAYKFEQENNDLSGVIETELFSITLEKVVEGLDVPWGMAFLPQGDMLITDRNGKFYRFSDDKRQEISNAPVVLDKGQGGLMDVELHPDFENNNWIYLTYSKAKEQEGKTLATTVLMRAKLHGNNLTENEIIFEALPYLPTRHHYGSRIEFDDEGYLFVTVGDRGRRDENPQNLDNHCGKVHRLHDDGAIPEDNPFVDSAGAMKSIYSYGHRNQQGMEINPKTGELWAHEHGPRGGDELNLIKPGVNYGWPVISYGINYNGTTFTNLTEKEGMEQPVIFWVPSIAPSGMTFVSSDKYPGWEGDVLIGSLRFKYLNRCKLVGDRVVNQEKLLKNIGRVRDVKMGNDGYIYVAVENPGTIYRIVPE